MPHPSHDVQPPAHRILAAGRFAGPRSCLEIGIGSGLNSHYRTKPRGGGTEIPQCTFSRLLVNRGLSLAIVLGMTVNDVSGKAIANLGWKEIKLRLRYSIRYSESEVLEKRESNLRPTQGIVTVHTRAFNQDGV